MILGIDTATTSTVAAVWAPDGRGCERRDDPASGERPQHASRLLALVEEALSGAGASWDEIERIAVGVGPAASPACATASRPPARSPRGAGCR